MTKGDIILITFPFTDLSGSKMRPAIVLADFALDVMVCFITTQAEKQEITDVELLPNSINGLRKQSLIRTSKIATLEKSLAKGLIGNLNKDEVRQLDANLKTILQIS